MRLPASGRKPKAGKNHYCTEELITEELPALPADEEITLPAEEEVAESVPDAELCDAESVGAT